MADDKIAAFATTGVYGVYMDIKKVLLLGGSGFVGSYIASRLSELGITVTVPTRRRERTKALITLSGVEMVQSDIQCEKTLTELIRKHDAVINLVGILHSRDVEFPYSRDFARAHVELPKKIIAACKVAGVRRLLHMSALKAAPDGPSEYLASKAEGERLVLAAQSDLDVTVFRPSVIFGRGDAFLSAFEKLLKWAPILPLGSVQARFQPVWAGDVADAFVHSLSDAASFGKAYDLCGPKTYSLLELIEYTAQLCGRHPRIVPLNDTLAYVQAGLMWLAPKPLLSPDNLRSMEVDNVCDASCTPFPVWQPRELESVAPLYIANHTPRGRIDARRFHAGR